MKKEDEGLTPGGAFSLGIIVGLIAYFLFSFAVNLLEEEPHEHLTPFEFETEKRVVCVEPYSSWTVTWGGGAYESSHLLIDEKLYDKECVDAFDEKGYLNTSFYKDYSNYGK